MGQPNEPERRQELSVRPGSTAGWTDPPDGPVRCIAMGHEVGQLLELPYGLLVGYCVRCSARFEAPWIQGGTAAVLAQTMAVQAITMSSPADSVLADLDQVAGLLADDAEALERARALVAEARAYVATRIGL